MNEESDKTHDLTDDHTENQESKAEKSLSEAKRTSFTDVGVSDVLSKLLSKKGWEAPTEIQEKSLPFSLKGKDVAGFAQTGTGKTGAFLITFIESFLAKKDSTKKDSKLPSALILCPTRELAIQIEEEARDLFGELGLRTLAIYGGASVEPQINALNKGVDLVTSTPGRLLDLYEQKALKLDQVDLFICDEVDRMFDMGFSKDVESIMGKLPEKVQKLAFSATLDDRAKELCSHHLDNPEFVSLNELELAPESIKQNAIICESEEKIKLLLTLLRKHEPTCALVFANTKLVTSWLLFKLEKNGFNVEMISGDLPQNKRTKLISKIKKGDVKILIATDVASRGLHIPNVSHVYNFDLPDDSANYIHRIGRTARAGASGESYSFICEDYAQNFEAIKKLLGDKAPKASYLDKSLLDGVEDLAKKPFGEKEERRFQPQRRTPPSDFRREPRRSFDQGERPRTPYKKSSDKVGQSKPRTERNSSQKRDNKRKKPFAQNKKSKKSSSGLIGKIFSLFSKNK